MARFYVALTTDEYRALVALAAEERRPASDQAAVLISRGLHRIRRVCPARRSASRQSGQSDIRQQEATYAAV